MASSLPVAEPVAPDTLESGITVDSNSGTNNATPLPRSPPPNKVNLTDQTNLGLPKRKVIAIFLGLSLCTVVSTLDSVITATSLPTISAAFSAGSVVSWVPSAYLLMSTTFQPVYGRMSDIFGRKMTLIACMLVFMIGNLASGFCTKIIQLIVLRGVSGVGGGGLISLMQIVVSDIVSLRERGKYQGLIGGVVAAGYCFGPVMGGALAQHLGWQWTFWITVPLSFIAIGVITFLLPLKRVEGNLWSKLKVVDYLGVGLTLGACALLLLPLIWGGVTFPWASAVVLAPLCSGFVCAGLFCFWEWKGARLPIVPMYIFRHSTVCGVYITMFVNGFIFFSSIYYLPQFFQVVLRMSPTASGTFLIPLLITWMAASWAAGISISRTGRYRRIIHSGFMVWSVGCGCLSTVDLSTSKAAKIVFMILAGIGGGMTLQTTTVAAQASVSRRDMSVVTAFRNFARQLGGTLSLAVGSALINNSLRSTMASTLSLPESTIDAIVDKPSIASSSSTLVSPEQAAEIIQAYIRGYRDLFVLNAALAAGATVVSVLLIKHKDLSRPEDVKAERKEKGDIETKTPQGEGGSGEK